MNQPDIQEVISESERHLKQIKNILNTHEAEFQDGNYWNKPNYEFLIKLYKPWKQGLKNTKDTKAAVPVINVVPQLLSDYSLKAYGKICKKGD